MSSFMEANSHSFGTNDHQSGPTYPAYGLFKPSVASSSYEGGASSSGQAYSTREYSNDIWDPSVSGIRAQIPSSNEPDPLSFHQLPYLQQPYDSFDYSLHSPPNASAYYYPSMGVGHDYNELESNLTALLDPSQQWPVSPAGRAPVSLDNNNFLMNGHRARSSPPDAFAHLQQPKVR